MCVCVCLTILLFNCCHGSDVKIATKKKQRFDAVQIVQALKFPRFHRTNVGRIDLSHKKIANSLVRKYDALKMP